MHFSARWCWVAWGATWLLLGGGALGQEGEVVQRGRHHSVVRRIVVERLPGEGKLQRTNTWVQLEDGLNYWDESEWRWKPTEERVEIVGKGAVAVRGQHRAVFSSNANDPEGALDLELPGGGRLRSSILAMRYFDAATGGTVLLGTVRDTRGEWVPPNQVRYRNVFDEVRADLIYTYRKGGLEADVVLRELPPSPGEVGLVPETTRLEVVTEFFEAPEPFAREEVLASLDEPELREAVAEPDWLDEALDFGTGRIGQGRAFAWSAREAAQRRPEAFPRVGKRWVRTEDGRTLLIESVDFPALLDDLVNLPGTAARQKAVREHARAWAGRAPAELRREGLTEWVRSGPGSAGRWGGGPQPAPGVDWVSVRRPSALESVVGEGLALAAVADLGEPGLVVDWNLVTAGSTNFTFAATNTYYVTGPCTFTGTTTIEGGTVVKFPATGAGVASLTVNGPLVCRTSAYRPAVFTAESDNTVGEEIVAGTPDPLLDYGTRQLRFLSTGVPLRLEHLRLKHGSEALYFDGNNPDSLVRHCQVVGSRFPVSNSAATRVRLENVLIQGGKPTGRVFSGVSTPFQGEHVTLHEFPSLLSGGTLVLTNSIVVAVADVQTYSGSGNWQAASSGGVFQSVGAGRHYLPAGSPLRNAGDAGIRPGLKEELRGLTTESPFQLVGGFADGSEYFPRAARDADVPDLGYHYPPIDYVVQGQILTNGVVRFRDGVVVGTYGTAGIVLGPGGGLESLGTAFTPNRFVHHALVQEQTVSPWAQTTGDLALFGLWWPGSGAVPSVRWEFTEATMPGGARNRRLGWRHADNGPLVMALSHSQLRGLAFDVGGAWPGMALAWTNNLFLDSDIGISQSEGSGNAPMSVNLFNQLFRGGRLMFSNGLASASWVIRDNLFDPLELSTAGLESVASNNGFRAGFPGFGTAARTGLTMDFVVGSGGELLYPTSGGNGSLAGLIDAGSRSAVQAGLSPYTVRSDGVAEGTGWVDIGYHLPAPEGGGTDLVGQWKLDEFSGAVAADSSGNGRDGVLENGPVWSPAYEGNGLVFDGINDQVTVPDAPTLRLTSAFSLAFWVKKHAESADYVRLVGKGNPSQRNYGVWDVAGPSGKLLFQFRRADGTYGSFTSSTELGVNRWYHVVCVWDGARGQIYVDGKLDASAAMPGVPAISEDPLTFGYAGYHARFAGVLDEIQLFGRAVTETEVPALMRATDLGKPVLGRRGYWRLDQGSGGVVRDSSGGGRDGVLNFGPQWTAGRFANGLQFNGIDDQVTVPDHPSLRLTSGFTVAFWVNKSGEPVDFSRWVGKGGATARNFGIWDIAGPSARVMFQFRVAGGAYRTLSSRRELAVGTWYHVGATWDGAVGRLYIDGVLDASGSMPGPPLTSNEPLTFGYAGYHTRFPGKLDEVVVLNRAVTAGEMASLAGAGLSAPPLLGTVGAWSLNQTSGGQALDGSGNGHHGELSFGPRWAPGRMGNALSFDGVYDAVSIPDHPDLRMTDGFTVAFWVRKQSENADFVRYVGKGNPTLRNFGVWDQSGSSGRLLFQFRNPSGTYQTVGSRGSIPVGVWSHVACTWDGATGRIYVDGKLDVLGPMAGPPATSSDPLTLGYAGYHGRLAGELDEVEVYNRALSDTEVAGLLAWTPRDADRDGVPDVNEDRNGNGVRDPGETSLADVDSDDDGRSDHQERLDGTDPTEARSTKAVRLGAWHFDNPSDPWASDLGSVPWERTAVDAVALAPFVFGAEFAGAGSVLRYRDVEEDGRANLSTRQGTVQLLYFPYWASASPECPPGTAGTGPGAPVQLLSVGDFSIGIDAKGTNLVLRSPGVAGGWVTNVQASFRACVGDYLPEFPMEIQVSYGTNASAVFVNGQLLARGAGIQAIPNAGSRAHGVFFGSSPERDGQANGVIDSVVTYNVPLNLCTNAWSMSLLVTQSPPSVTLRWQAVSNCYYLIERRSPPETAWQRIASVTPPAYTDATVVRGKEYEYRLKADVGVPEEFRLSTDPAHLTMTSGVGLPAAENPGHVLLVVDGTLMGNAAFASAVVGLARDLSAEGWVVAQYQAPRHDDVVWSNNPARIAQVKQWIQAYHAAHPGQAKAVYLLGHVPIPRSGMLSPDGHPYRPLPADGYYGDVDGLWTDATQWVSAPGIAVPNVAGDGMFDQELIPVNAAGIAGVELAVGRVDFANLPAFSAGSGARSETELLIQYLAKTRRYRRGELPLPERVVMGAYFTSDAAGQGSDVLGRDLTKTAWRVALASDGTVSSGVVNADFFSAGLPAVWGVQGGFAGGYDWIHSRGPVNTYHGIVPHRTSDLVSDAAEPPIAFSIVEASWLCEWDAADHLGRGLLATRNYGYAWAYGGATRIQWQIPAMALGGTIGDAWKKTQNDAWMWPFSSVQYQPVYGTGVRVYLGTPSQGGYVFAALLGDPTLRQSPMASADLLQGATTAEGYLLLSWVPSPVPGATYHVYRTTDGVGSEWTRLTFNPLTVNSVYDPAPPPGARYMVRAMALKTVASGSFTNLSAGILWP